MDELIPANIVIGDRNYRIRIEAGAEETVRKTVRIINEKLLEFKMQFAGKDMQDYVSMVLLWYATEKMENSNAVVEEAGLKDQLRQLEQSLDSALGAEQ